MIAQPEHSQCPLVETDYTTSLCTSLCIGLSLVGLIFESMEKLSVEHFCETESSTFSDTDHASCSGAALAAEGEKCIKFLQCLNTISHSYCILTTLLLQILTSLD